MPQSDGFDDLIAEALLLRQKLNQASKDLTVIADELQSLKLRLDARSAGSGVSPVAERRLEVDKTTAPATE